MTRQNNSPEQLTSPMGVGEISSVRPAAGSRKFITNNDDFFPYQVVDMSCLTAAKEDAPDRRVSELFAPVVDDDTESDSWSNYEENDMDTLLTNGVSEEKEQEYLMWQITRADKKRPSLEPTPEDRLKAFKMINLACQADSVIERIIVKHIPSDLKGSEAVTLEMRTNKDLRYELGSYLLRDKMKWLATVPHRLPDLVSTNRQTKTPRVKGYERCGKLTSREYSSLLALSMLDGTFVYHTGDYIEINSLGRVIVGQHRYAAELLLTEDDLVGKDEPLSGQLFDSAVI